ncbi:MAG: acetyl-CoA carboxylase biotin carboxyl carrier protein subunit [Clostridia bacterium]|nr:acetyl-CoA carboxylase biotin carboxyl carrier protein subunit [Clostridia bacterium]
MRKYIVKVNGSAYEVEIEELSAEETMNFETKPAAPAAPAAPAPAAPAPAAPAGGKNITAPMPGSIISVSVKPGDTFRSGQVLLVLEAMKMENEIMAPHDGKVLAVNVSAGASVNSGDVLISYE